MKKLLFFAFAFAFGSGVHAQTYSPIAVTGYNADVVADGTGAVAASTTHDVDGVNYNFMAQGYTNPTPLTTTRGLPTGGLITSVVAATTGLTYQLAPYTANNSLRINGVGTGTLTFTTPTSAEKVYVLATSGSGTSIATMTVTFTDNSTQTFTQTVNDWYDNTGFAIQGIGRANRTDNGIDNNTLNPRLYQIELPLSVGNTTKPIQSISFTNIGAVLNVMGISVKNAATPPALDAGILALVSPGALLTPNTSQPVQVRLVNQGTTALTSATITWTIDGVAQTLYNWTGNLAFNQTATVTVGNSTFTPGSHTINACATNPNGGTDGFAANDCLNSTVNSCTILTGTYTIDKNSPVSATNFQTIGAAVAAMSSCGISGPVTFNVVAGTGPYNEQIEIPSITGASATNTITLNGNGETIQANPVSATRNVFKLNGADYVTINNFAITTDAAATYGWGIHFINGADNNTISNNTITIGTTSTTLSNSVGIVFSNSSSTATTTGNNGSYNVISGNTITGGYKGIAIYGLATSPGNNQILNNTVKNFYAVGIELGTMTGSLVEGNTITRPDRTSVLSASEMITLSGGTKSSIISKNRVHTTHGTGAAGTVYGVYSNTNDAPVGLENIVKNNLFYNFNSTGTTYGIHNNNSDGVYYYHNTFHFDNAANAGTVRGFNQTGQATNIRFNNNIVNIIGGASGAKHAIFYATTGSNIKSNFNDLMVTSTSTTSGIGTFGTANKTTLLDWQTASGDDSISVSVDPQFTSVTLPTPNFLPTNTALNNIGRPVTPAVTDDITNALRNPATPDPGAYEMGAFTPVTTDVAVTAIINPVSGCNLTNQEQVTITLSNVGATTVTSLPVSYTINGGTPVNETFTGSLAPAATVNYNFTTKANLSAPNTYTIVASIVDAVTTNNSITNVVVASAPAAVPTITAAGPTTFCLGGSVVLTAASTTTGATYTWFLNGTAIPGATSATYTANAAGSYTAVATANGCPSAASTATAVTVNAAPVIPVVTASGATTFCTGGSVTFTATSTTPGVTYQWFNNGTAIATATSATFAANASGSYTVTASANGCSATSTATSVTVNATPATPTITQNGFGLTSSSTTGNQWYLNGSPITGATGATYTTTANGTYTVIVTTNGCPSAASAAVTITNTGIRNGQEINVMVFPNPSTGLFNVTLPQGHAYEITVSDITGKVIMTQKTSDAKAQLNLQKAAKGIYLLKLVSEGKTATRKLIVE